MLIRPFDEKDDRLAVIEKRGWYFDCVVAPVGVMPEDQEMQVCYVDVQTTEEQATRTAMVLINENWLVELTKRVARMNILLAKDMGQDVDHIMGAVPNFSSIMAYKRTAVSLALEEVLDELDIWLDDNADEKEFLNGPDHEDDED